jgi:hypothetical protein
MSANQHTSLEAEPAVRREFLFPVFSCLLFLLVLAGCALPLGEDWRIDVKKSEETGTNYILNYDLQSYVPVPTAGEAPVKEFTGRRDVGVKVVWRNAAGADITESLVAFARNTVYQAEITLTVKNGYSFDPAVSFAYPLGAVKIQPAANTNAGERVLSTVTYKAAEPPVRVTDLNLTPYLAAPVRGATPVGSFSASQYTGTVAWSPSDGVFQADTSYTAVVTLTAASGYTFAGLTAGSFTHNAVSAGAVITYDLAYPGVVTVVFPKTDFTRAFSGSSLVEGDSAIDAIRAAKRAGWLEVSLKWDRKSEEVSLSAGTDIGAGGLVLANDGTNTFNAASNNSPAKVIIDGLQGTRTIAWSVPGPGENQTPLITVGDGVTLELRNITFQGTDYTLNRAPLIKVVSGGTLIMESGARLTGNTSTTSGGGVYVNGDFIMNGGTISDNTANGANGGGVYVGPNATFTMKNGTISGNTAKGGNTSATGHGGGVSMFSTATFLMENGTISGNTAIKNGSNGGNGGGVNAIGTFKKTGGTIYGDSDIIHNPGDIENTSTSDKGHAVSSFLNGNRNSTAGPESDGNLDSAISGSDGGWDA